MFVIGGLSMCFGSVYAQNNPYEIDDSLYKIFVEADKTIGSQSSCLLAEKMDRMAQIKGDKMAQCMAHCVLLLNHVKLKNTDKVRATSEKLCSLAVAYNYLHYRYFAWSNDLVFSLNNNLTFYAMELAKKMRQQAELEKDKYGLYMALKAMGNVALARGNYYLAAKYYRETVDYVSRELPNQDPFYQYAYLAMYYRMREDYSTSLHYIEEGKKHADKDLSFYILAVEKAATMCFSGRMFDFEQAYQEARKLEQEKGVVEMDAHYKLLTLRDAADGNMSRAHARIDSFFTSLEATRLHGMLYMLEGDWRQVYYTRLKGKQQYDSLLFQIMKNDQMELDSRLGNNRIRMESMQLKLANSRILLQKQKAESQLLESQNLHGMLMHKNNELQHKKLRMSSEIQRLQEQRNKEKTETLKMEERRGNLRLIFLFSSVFLLLIFLTIHLLRTKKDIKELEESEKQLTIAREKARESERMKSVFIQNMSHEIRTPLNAISGFSQLMLDSSMELDDQERLEFSRIISHNSDLITTLVNDLLTLSELESGQYKMHFSKEKINHLCQLSLQTVNHRQKPGVPLIFQTDADDAQEVETDGRRVRQVLINMLTNAIKYTEKGSIKLRCSLADNPDYVTFSVEDTGPGVPPEKAEVIFGRFEKLDDYHQGTGLGLNICRLISDRLGGRVFLDTTYTHGARFVFMIRRMLTLLILLFSLSSSPVSAQNNIYKIHDELYSCYVRAERHTDCAQMLSAVDSMYQKAVRLKDKKAQCLAHTIPVQYFYEKDDAQALEKAVVRLKKTARATGYLRYYYFAWNLEASFALSHNEIGVAIDKTRKAYDEAKKDKNPFGIFSGLKMMCDISKRMGNTKIFYDYCMEGIQFTQSKLPEQDPSFFYLGAVSVLYSQEKYEEAYALLEKGRKHLVQESYLPYYQHYRAMLLYRLGQEEQAETVLQQCIAEARSSNNQQLVLELETNSHIFHCQYDMALQKAQNLHDIQLRNSYMQTIYAAMGDYQKACLYLHVMGGLTDSLAQEANMADLSSLVAYSTSSVLSLQLLQLQLDNIHRELEQLEWKRLQEDALRENTKVQLANDSLEMGRLQAQHELRRLELERNTLSERKMQAMNRLKTMGRWGVLIILFMMIIYFTIHSVRVRKYLKHSRIRNRELAEELAKAEEGERLKTAFVRNMSHEIRTPLNAIVGFTELLVKQDVRLSAEEKQQFREIILQNTSLLTHMVNDILYLSSIESGKRTVVLQPLKCNALCRNILEEQSAKNKHVKHVRFESTVEDETEVMTDSNMLNEVLRQLLSNAFSYAAEGEIILQCNHTECPGYVTFAVADHGPGIPADKQRCIFNRFEKLDTFKTGVGLGLSICKAIAVRLDAIVGIDSSYNEGARFYFRIPHRSNPQSV